LSARIKVTDFIAVECGESGVRSMLVTAGVATSVLLASLGFVVGSAAADPCNPQMVHYNEYNESPHDDHYEFHDDHNHSCTD